MVVETDLLANTERVRSDDYGRPLGGTERPAIGVRAGGRFGVNVEDVARLTTEAILANRFYVLPHQAARESIQRRFGRIDRTFDEQAAEGWTH